MAIIHELKNTDRKTITERHIYTQEIMKMLRKTGVGETVTYDDMRSAIGLGVQSHQDGYGYQYSARMILERDENIAFDVVPNVGLRRLSPELVALGTGDSYLKKKKSLLRRSKRRMSTIDDHYENLSNEAKMRVTAHRTIMAFDQHLLKRKNIAMIEAAVSEKKDMIGFDDTLALFQR